MKIFAIAGTFFQRSERLGISHLSEAEGGTMAVITEESMSHVFSGHFQIPSLGNCYGLLLDAYGQSILEGAMTDDRLSFQKIYERTGNSVWYNYKKCGNIWIGTYEGDVVPQGPTRCVITEIGENLFPNGPAVTES